MLKLEEVRRRLKTANQRATARAAGVSPLTVWRIANGKPTLYDAVEKLSNYFEDIERKNNDAQ